MDTPPPLPARKPLGALFYVLLIGPLAAMGLAVAIDRMGGGRSQAADWGIPLSLLAMLVMLTCSIICAIMIGKRHGAGLGVLSFIGIQVVYLAASFAGCGMILQGANFH